MLIKLEKEIESELAKIKELDYKNVKVIKMSAYYSIFLQVKVTENMSIKKYLAASTEIIISAAPFFQFLCQ